MKCRHCAAQLALTLVDLGSAPPSNAYLTERTLNASEKWFPLRVLVCEQCWLVQTADFHDSLELFNSDYAYFSAFSTSWLAHCERYVSAVTERFRLDGNSHVVEVAANDGYLLDFVIARGIPSTGVEPTASTAAVAQSKGIPIIEDFFGVRLATEMAANGKQADLTFASNVLGHVPDINDFVRGFALLLKPGGVATFEFPHLVQLIEGREFDTMYHEHFSYLSLTAVSRIFSANGLAVFDVEEYATHGGSLRVFAQRADTGARPVADRPGELLRRERESGLESAAYYSGFQAQAEQVKDEFVAFLLDAKRRGKRIAAYGAAAKGNTLMNYAGTRKDLIPFVVDRNPSKQGKYMPGSRIPIVEEARLAEYKPDYVVILPWNIRHEVMEQLAYVRAWGGQFVTAIPELRVV